MLHDDSYASWQRWLQAVGAKNVNARRGIICGDRSALIQATLEGHGVALIPELFLLQDLSAGRLVKVFSDAIDIDVDFSIYAVCLPKRLEDPLVADAMDWLAREATETNLLQRHPGP